MSEGWLAQFSDLLLFDQDEEKALHLQHIQPQSLHLNIF